MADNELTVMAARYPQPRLTIQRRPYAKIKWARESAELVTDGAAGLRSQLQSVTGERFPNRERRNRQRLRPSARGWTSYGTDSRREPRRSLREQTSAHV